MHMDTHTLFHEWFPQYTLGEPFTYITQCGGGCCDLPHFGHLVLYEGQVVQCPTNGCNSLFFFWPDYYNPAARTEFNRNVSMTDALREYLYQSVRLNLTCGLEEMGRPVLVTSQALRMEPQIPREL